MKANDSFDTFPNGELPCNTFGEFYISIYDTWDKLFEMYKAVFSACASLVLQCCDSHKCAGQ